MFFLDSNAQYLRIGYFLLQAKVLSIFRLENAKNEVDEVHESWAVHFQPKNTRMK